ncbi:hypothetical protein [Brevibacillus brevis]|uniref:hypothetical protein n=1 Tax=Brevibacillus brevis TaxID=1393 RepID=UPI0025A4E7EF|nr:hypothetical protein [Brevibacillus brevis]WJQ81317.1 hypothetical protein QN310_28420 [Brevibacillus brevis]
MKKRNVILSGLFLVGVVFVGSSLYASEDIESYIKGNHMKAIHAMGIEVKDQKLENMATITDANGKKWVFNEFTKSTNLIETMREKYEEDVAGPFISVQDEIMQEYAKPGDSIPTILLDETLKEGYFAFIREDGEALSFKIKYDNGSWEYELEK